MTFVGMDPVEVRTVADGLLARSRDLEEVRARVDGLIVVAAASWPGPDSDAFRELWTSTLRGGVGTVSQELAARSTWLLAQIDEQVEVSAASGGAATPAGGPAGGAKATYQAAVTPGSLLDLSRAAYEDKGDVGGWHRLSDAELRALGLDPSSVRDPATGFSASVFRSPDGEYVVAYRGTTEWFGPQVAGKDLQADLHGSVGLSRQSEQAVALALALKNAVGGDNVTFTGHSLGGRLAALSAVATGAHAETFNAAGMSPTELMYAKVAGGGEVGFFQWLGAHGPSFLDRTDAAVLGIDTSNITNYRGVGDPLTGVQEQVLPAAPDAVGRQVDVFVDDPNPLKWHDLDAMEAGVDRLSPGSTGGGSSGGGGNAGGGGGW